MKIFTCPYCKSEIEVEEQEHYDMIDCPDCKREFQALQKGTMSVALNFLEELKQMGIQDDDGEE